MSRTLRSPILRRAPTELTADVASQMVEILEVQAGLSGLANLEMGTWDHGVVFENWDDQRGEVVANFPEGSRLVQAVDQIASSCSPEPLNDADLVHPNFVWATPSLMDTSSGSST